jgi:hypothetical protein
MKFGVHQHACKRSVTEWRTTHGKRLFKIVEINAINQIETPEAIILGAGPGERTPVTQLTRQ